jgi:two-component system, OmpR family, sensor kinase
VFRTLRTRLVASYVFAAIVLVVVASFAVTAFALSVFGIGARESVETVAHAAPDEVRLAEAHYGTLEAATPEIVKHLVRPGVGVAILATSGRSRHFLGGGFYDDGPQFFASARDAGFGQRGTGQHQWPPPLRFQPPDAGNARGSFAAPGSYGPPSSFGPPGSAGFPGAGGPPRNPTFERIPPFPFGLNSLLRIEPQSVIVPGGVIRVVADPRMLVSTVNAAWIAMLPIGAFVILAAWFFGRIIAGQALRPLEETTEALKRFADGDFTPRPVVAADRNEIGELVLAYNGAVAQVSSAFEERRRVEMHMRQFVADASHELRTPLTVIMGFIDVLRKRTANEAAISSKIYDTMLAESRRMKSLIDKLIALARLENPQASPDLGDVDLSELAEQTVVAAKALRPEARIEMQAQPVVVFGSSHELREAISNLVENALKYAAGSTVHLDVRPEGEDAVVLVSDNGPGLALEDRPHVFDRFYRGQNRGETEGHGLGLAIVKRAVERAGGTIVLDTASGQGCRFTIRLPRARGDYAGEDQAIAV